MNILVLGASYGLLVASILLEKGFKCTIVCNEDEDENLKKNGFVLNVADKNLFYSSQIFLENKVLSSTPINFDYNKKYDLCFLTIQEGQLGQNEISKLMEFIGSSKIPLISLMNIPPLSFVNKITKSKDTIFSKAYNFPDIWKDFDQNYVTHASSDPQIYKKLDPNKPSYTITGSGGGGTHGYHYKENRALTNRERARIQTFPDEFTFQGSIESVRKQIGMAVPPKLSEVIFKHIVLTLANKPYDHIEPNIKFD
jgi:hypothetical protein